MTTWILPRGPHYWPPGAGDQEIRTQRCAICKTHFIDGDSYMWRGTCYLYPVHERCLDQQVRDKQ